MKFRKFFSLISIVIGFISCSNSTATFGRRDLMISHLKNEENGYSHHKEINGIKINLIYWPTDLLVQQDLPENYTSKDIAKSRKKYEERLYFILSFSINQQEIINSFEGNQREFGEWVNQISFGMEEQVRLVTKNRDTVVLTDYIYPRMYGMSSSTDLLLVYPRADILAGGDSFKVILNDKNLGLREVEVELQTAPIKKQPRLEF